MERAMTQATFTFRVDDKLKSEFAAAAKAKDRTSAQLLRDFMRDYVQEQQQAAAYDAWFREQVQIGIDSANAGNLVDADEVEAMFAARRSETLRKLDGK